MEGQQRDKEEHNSLSVRENKELTTDIEEDTSQPSNTEEENTVDDSGNWTEVTERRRRSRIKGRRPRDECSLRAGDRTAWLYVGRLHRLTTEETLRSYLGENGVTEVICEKLDSRGTNSF